MKIGKRHAFVDVDVSGLSGPVVDITEQGFMNAAQMSKIEPSRDWIGKQLLFPDARDRRFEIVEIRLRLAVEPIPQDTS